MSRIGARKAREKRWAKGWDDYYRALAANEAFYAARRATIVGLIFLALIWIGLFWLADCDGGRNLVGGRGYV